MHVYIGNDFAPFVSSINKARDIFRITLKILDSHKRDTVRRGANRMGNNIFDPYIR